MKGRGAAVFFLVIAVAALWQAWRWGLTDFGSPGPGLFPALAALLMGIAAVAAAWQREAAPAATNWPRLIVYIAAVILVPLLLQPLGMIAVIALLFLLLLRGLERMPWRVVLPVTAAASIGAFLLFDQLLKVPLPRGWWVE